MKRTLSLFLFFIILSFGCSREEESTLKLKPLQNQITLIFKNHKSNAEYLIGGERSVRNTYAYAGMEIESINTLNMTQRYSLDFETSLDTVAIATTKELQEIKLTYRAIDELTYYFQNGDTVLIEYDGVKPYAQILNRNESPRLTNIQFYLRDSLIKTEFTPLLELTNGGLSSMRWVMNGDQTIDINEFVENYKIEQSELVLEQFNALQNILDQLDANGQIDLTQKAAIISDFYWSLKKELGNDKIQKNIEKYGNLRLLASSIETQYPKLIARSDSLLNSINYQRFLYQQPYRIYDIKTLSKEGKGYGARTSNHISTYDSIRKSNQFSQNEKLILQYRNIDKMLENSSFFELEDRLVYLTRFKNDFQDTALFNQLVEKYDVKFEIDDNIELVDAAGVQTTLESFVSKHKGKVIYLDFWASWCGPCIKEIPASKALKSELKDTEVEFLYLSTDRRNKAWKEAQEKHQFTGENHYRITNANNSLAMNELNVIFIPRYMIFDKSGELVNNDAPRPSDKDNLLRELNKYLDQE